MYADWVDRVLNAAAQVAAGDDDAAIFGLQTLRLPAALGFGEVASQPGFMEGPLWEALHDAIRDLAALGLIEDNDVWRVKLSREGLKATDLSISTSWHRIFDEIEPSEQEMQLLAYAAREGVVEEEDWARTRWLTASETFRGLGWDWDVARALRITGGLKELRCIDGHGFLGGEFRYHPTYIGIVRATEAPRFKKGEVPPGAPVCFISYAHEDARLARDIAYGLQGASLGVEIDEEMLASGDSLVDRVAEATARVEFVVAIISRHSVVSKWCKYELALAMADELVMPGVKVLPVRVGSVEMPPVLRNKVYRSVETLGTDGTIRALVEDIEKHRSRLSELQ